MTVFLKCMATNKLQGSIQLSGKTSQIVHKMLQDMVLGTVERNRVQEFKREINNPKKLKRKHTNLMQLFLTNKLADKTKEKLTGDEEDLRNNLHKYDIFEERNNILTSSEGASTSRKVIKSEDSESKNQIENSGGEEIKSSKEASLEHNSLNELDQEKSLSMKKLVGYFKDK